MANKHMKRYSTPLIIKEMQIKIIMKYASYPLRMTIKNKKKITNVNKSMEIKTLLHGWWNSKMAQPLWENLTYNYHRL